MYESGHECKERKEFEIMTTYKHLWEELISDENIIEAVYSAARGSIRGKRKTELLEIRANVEFYVPDIRNLIINYEPIKHIPMIINDGITQKKREIIVPTIPEHIVQHAVMLVLKPIFLKGMYEHSYASIPGRGCHNGAERLQLWIKDGGRHVKYCAKFDIKKFFENIDQDVLIDKLGKIIKDELFMDLLIKIIRTSDKGLPLGFYTSQWFANFYLQGFDHYVKEQLGVKYYMRYMDDMVLLGSNKKELHRVKEQMLEYLQDNLHVWFKDNWQIFRFDYKDGDVRQGRFIDFMGFKFYRDHITMRKTIARKAMRKARKLSKKDIITPADARQMLAYHGWIKHTDSYDFTKKYIEPYVDFNELKKIISYDDKRRNDTYVDEG